MIADVEAEAQEPLPVEVLAGRIAVVIPALALAVFALWSVSTGNHAPGREQGAAGVGMAVIMGAAAAFLWRMRGSVACEEDALNLRSPVLPRLLRLPRDSVAEVNCDAAPADVSALRDQGLRVVDIAAGMSRSPNCLIVLSAAVSVAPIPWYRRSRHTWPGPYQEWKRDGCPVNAFLLRLPSADDRARLAYWWRPGASA